MIRCRVDESVARGRMERRLSETAARAAHADAEHLALWPRHEPLSLAAPTLEVDTGDGYRPELDAISHFCR